MFHFLLSEATWRYLDSPLHKLHLRERICSASFLASSALWACTPRLRRYREIHPDTRPAFASDMGQRFAKMLKTLGAPAVVCVEKPYLEGFTDGFAGSAAGDFILLAVNGGDAPLSAETQRRIASLPGLKACFAMNLHTPSDERFFPLPVGLPHHCDGLHRGNLRGSGDAELLIERIWSCSSPWQERDTRLLVTPMQASRLRTRYVELLTQPVASLHCVVRKLTHVSGPEPRSNNLVLLKQSYPKDLSVCLDAETFLLMPGVLTPRECRDGPVGLR
ncbi:styx-b [Symbiodinium natans]|uniref:Styx-b protein n=1 Tax=Symbiodinium natans TaxID=878477 RepID=A0A812T5L3_9DINO|nr:styx-b [Symbiodinium natans]